MRLPICLAMMFPLVLPAQAPGPVVRATVSEVLLDFVVRDKKAHVVRDLRPEEIQVLEDGVPQKLRHFQFVEGRQAPAAQPEAPQPAAAAAAEAPKAPAGPPAAPRSVNELRDISVVSVLVGQLNQQGRQLALETMRSFLKTELRPDTYIGVFWMDPYLRAIAPYSNDAEKISRAMDKAVTRVGLRQMDEAGLEPDVVFQATPDTITGADSAIASAIASVMATSWITELHDVYQASVRELGAIRSLVQAQQGIPGRKVILLFSAGLPIHPDTLEALKGSISAANRSNVTIYAMDTRVYTGSDLAQGRRLLAGASRASMGQMMGAVRGGDQSVTPDQAMALDMASASVHANIRENLAQLAEGTGGALLPSVRDLREPLHRAMEEARTHYELSYSPSNAETDGRFRKIDVKVSRPGVSVFARNGYYALPLVDGRQVYPFELETMKALNTKPLPRQFEFHAAALEFRPGLERSQFSLAVEAPERELAMVEEGKSARLHLAITALVKDENGQVVEKISKDIHYEVPAAKAAGFRRGAVSFTAPFFLAPGRYTLETAAVDRQNRKASVRRSLLVVDPSSGLSMSDVSLVRRVDTLEGPGNAADPLQARGGKVIPELSDSIASNSGGALQFYAVAYPPAPVDAPIEMSVEIARDGQTVARAPAATVPPDRSGAAPVLASLPLEKLPPGRYEAKVTFHYKGQAVTRETAFTVEPEK